MEELKQIDYETFKKFIESDKNEAEYFFKTCNISSAQELVPLDYYVSEFKKRVDLYSKDITAIIKKINEKNPWVNDVTLCPNGNMVIVNNTFLNAGIEIVKGEKSFNNINLFDTDSFLEFIFDFGCSIQSLKLSHSLRNNSNEELLELEQVRKELFEGYKDKTTVSNIIKIEGSSNRMYFRVKNGKKLVSLCDAYLSQDNVSYSSMCLSGAFSDLPYNYYGHPNMYKRNKFLNEEEAKQVVKKLMINK